MTTDTQELRELAEKATPGPWCDDGCGCVDTEISGLPVARFFGGGSDGISRGYDGSLANAAYIAAANPTAVLSLLDELDTLREQVATLREALECADVGMCAVGVPHKGEREVLQQAVNIVRKALAATEAGEVG